MTSMTDQARVNALMTALFTSSTACTITPGTGGGSVLTATPPYALRLMSVAGSNTANGTECTAVNCPGYVALGSTLGTTFCAAAASGQQTNSNSVTWSATGTWTVSPPSIEIWDVASGTKLRWLQGPLTSAITGVVSGDSVQFSAGSISTNASTW
jgi:hypothetical protein